MTDTQTQLNDAQLELLKQAQAGGLSDLWSSIGPENQTALKNSLLGGLVGGVGGAGAGMMSDKKSPVSTGLLGALMGAIAGGGGTLGYQLLSGQRKFPGEPSRPAISMDSPVDYAADKMLKNPGLAAGTAAGGLWSLGHRATLPKALEAIKGTKNERAMTNAIEALAGKGRATFVDPANATATTAKQLYTQGRGLRLNWLNDLAKKAPTPIRRALQGLNNKIAFGRFVKGRTRVGHPLSMAAIPLGMGTGYMVDRYLRGSND